MADKVDAKKLQAFVEAAITNPRHPVYQLGMEHSPILQHYHLNVMTLETIRPEQWFSDYPHYTARLQEVLALCEQDAASAARPDPEVETLKSKVADLEAKLAALTQPPTAAPSGADAPPAGVIPPTE